MEWSTACPDWEKRIVAGRSLIPFKPLYPAEAAKALDIFKTLRVPDLPGQPTFGEVTEQWVFDFVASVFGAYDSEHGKQAIREYFLLISKKNTKSTIAAAIMLTALILNWRHNEEILILSPTVEVAQNSFAPAAAMVRADPELDATAQGFLQVSTHTKTITHLKTRAALKVVAADADTVSGKKAGRILIDEYWLFGKRANADAMLGEATGGLVSRPEGFIIGLTTQSDEPPAGVFKDKLDYARKVRDGEIENRKFLPILYEFPRKMLDAEAYLDPDNFYVTNPNMGRSVDAEWIADKLREESEKGPRQRNIILAKHLNVQIGGNLHTDRWAGADLWPKCVDRTLTLETLIERSELAVVGLDGGGLDDLFGLTVLGREKVTRNWLSWSHAWAHESVFERRKSIATVLNDFVKAGDLTIVREDGGDIADVVEIIQSIDTQGKLATVAVDPAGITAVVDALADVGVTQDSGKLLGVAQGVYLMGAIKGTERKLMDRTLLHAPSALMDWCVGNLKIEPTATGIRATKLKAGDAKIDPIMALFDAAWFMTRNPEVKQEGRLDDFLNAPIMVI